MNEQRFILWDKANDEEGFYGRIFTKDEAREELATVYFFEALNEELNTNEMSLEELLGSDWELRPVESRVLQN